MPHLRGKRSLEARRRRQKEYLIFFGHPKPTKTYEPFFQRKKFTPINLNKERKNLSLHERDTLRSRVRECKICGWNHYPEALIIHHVNKNKHDNHLYNLVVLCRNCHYLLHRGLAVLPEEKADGS